jgi:hypothetical protein
MGSEREIIAILKYSWANVESSLIWYSGLDMVS